MSQPQAEATASHLPDILSQQQPGPVLSLYRSPPSPGFLGACWALQACLRSCKGAQRLSGQPVMKFKQNQGKVASLWLSCV